MDGRTAGPLNSAAASLLPKALRVVLVLAESDVSWHSVRIPKAPAARLRDALLGVMEEALLDDDLAVHLALAPDAVAGQVGWVAVTHAPRLVAALNALEGAGISVDSVVAAAAPAAQARGHFFTTRGDQNEHPWLSLARENGVVCLRLAGGLAGALQVPDAEVQWTSTPAAALAAERWLGAAVPLQTEAERLLESARSPANLRQFDLAVRHRGTRLLRDLGKRFFSSDWRPVRIGLVCLLALQVLGLNAQAWQQQRAVVSKRVAIDGLLRSTHPGVRTILDAPAQMSAETDRLRAAAGRPGAADFEAMLASAAAAWPQSQGAASALRFDNARLTLAAPGWSASEQAQFRDRLGAVGYAVEFAEGRLTMSLPTRKGLT